MSGESCVGRENAAGYPSTICCDTMPKRKKKRATRRSYPGMQEGTPPNDARVAAEVMREIHEEIGQPLTTMKGWLAKGTLRSWPNPKRVNGKLIRPDDVRALIAESRATTARGQAGQLASTPITPKQMADRTGLSVSSIHQMKSKGEISGYTVGEARRLAEARGNRERGAGARTAAGDAKTRVTLAQARVVEARASALEGSMLHRAETEAVVEMIARVARAGLSVIDLMAVVNGVLANFALEPGRVARISEMMRTALVEHSERKLAEIENALLGLDRAADFSDRSL